jgi:membrane-bound serine protease (ClpP class)
MKLIRITLLTLLLVLGFSSLAGAQSSEPLAIILTAEGPIMPPMLEYFQRGIKTAEQRDAELLVIELNTPGGSVDTMLDIIQDIRSSTVPVVVYVAPKNAMAGSAGALITMAGHASAMAPDTVIGAASPIQSSGENIQSTLESKVKETLKAKARSLVEERGDEAVQLAEAMIDDATAVTAKEALEANLVDFIADDTEDLLQALNGFEVKTEDGTRTLNTENIRTENLEISFIEQLLLMLTDPNIAFLLLAIGVQAILIEISSPGGWVAGFIGAVCLTLAIYGMGVLTVNWFGVIFLDIKAPTHGALTAAGVASFIVGALVLFNSPGTPQFQRVSVPLVIGMGIFLGLLFFGILLIALRAQHRPIQTGSESMIGKTGSAKTAVEREGQVQVGSELWSAEKSAESEPIRKGDPVEVVEVRGLRLIVRKK